MHKFSIKLVKFSLIRTCVYIYIYISLYLFKIGGGPPQKKGKRFDFLLRNLVSRPRLLVPMLQLQGQEDKFECILSLLLIFPLLLFLLFLPF